MFEGMCKLKSDYLNEYLLEVSIFFILFVRMRLSKVFDVLIILVGILIRFLRL